MFEILCTESLVGRELCSCNVTVHVCLTATNGVCLNALTRFN